MTRPEPGTTCPSRQAGTSAAEVGLELASAVGDERVGAGELHLPLMVTDEVDPEGIALLHEAPEIEVVERPIWPEELESFEQFFLTGTAAEVTPVASVGPWNFEVGDLTLQLRSDYLDLVNRRLTNA